MVDAGTLATTAQVILTIGTDASATQLLEANTNIWILFAEADMSMVADIDLIAKNAQLKTNFIQYMAMVASHRAAWYAVNSDTTPWGLSNAQSKMNVFDSIWLEFTKYVIDKDRVEKLGYTF